MWNPWHGCHKLSEGCRNCYVYRRDARYQKDSSLVEKTAQFNLPLRRGRDGRYLLRDTEPIFTCGTSDFFVEEADAWREEAWRMIRQRPDLRFLIITKRIDRFTVALPDDWEMGYPNVMIGCTVENQDRADYRLPLFLDLPIAKRTVCAEPLLEAVDLYRYLRTGKIDGVVAGGESGEQARVCDYRWILSLQEQCVDTGVAFWFKQTGARFVKDGRLYAIKRPLQHAQARRAGINYQPDGKKPFRAESLDSDG